MFSCAQNFASTNPSYLKDIRFTNFDDETVDIFKQHFNDRYNKLTQTVKDYSENFSEICERNRPKDPFTGNEPMQNYFLDQQLEEERVKQLE